MNPLWRLAEKLSPADARLHYNFFLMVISILVLLGAITILDYFAVEPLVRIVVDVLVFALILWRFYAFIKELFFRR